MFNLLSQKKNSGDSVKKSQEAKHKEVEEKKLIKKEKRQQYPKYFSTSRVSEDEIEVNLHKSYRIKNDHKYHDEIETWVFLANEKKYRPVRNKINLRLNLEYYPSFQFYFAECKMQQQICTICLCEFQIKQNKQLQQQMQIQKEDDIYMLECQHKFHLGCLQNLIQNKDWVSCPVCKKIIGKMIGDQPDGQMNVSFDPSTTVPGYGKGLITINYIMKSGSKNGKFYSGTQRTAYLPDDKQGREVLELLRQAFNRKLIFTVGRSVTTGLDNQTVWNGIHHKTSLAGGASHFGYPDPTYLSRVKEELAAKGVTLQSIKLPHKRQKQSVWDLKMK